MAAKLSTRDRIEQRLKPFPRHFIVSYALDVALTVAHLDPSAEGAKCRDLTARWLNGESISDQELRAAAYATSTTTPASAAYTTTAYAYASAAYASAAYASAAYASAAYAYADKHEQTMLQYEHMLETKIKSLTRLERLIWGIGV